MKKMLRRNHGWTLGVLNSIVIECERVMACLENEGELAVAELELVLKMGEHRIHIIRQMLEKDSDLAAN